jgi:hypothetical protein
VGPWFVLVSWLFDFLRHAFDPNRYPDTLKQWHFYVLLGLILVGVTLLPIWRFCEWARDRLLNYLGSSGGSVPDGGPV